MNLNTIELIDQILKEKEEDLNQHLSKQTQITKQQPKIKKEKLKKTGKDLTDPLAKRNHKGKKWVDNSMTEWPAKDYRIFIGNIGDEVTDEHLLIAFKRFKSLLKVKVIRNKFTNKSRGYGFASFADSSEYIRAIKELNGKYIGKKPIMLKRSDWQKRATNQLN